MTDHVAYRLSRRDLERTRSRLYIDDTVAEPVPMTTEEERAWLASNHHMTEPTSDSAMRPEDMGAHLLSLRPQVGDEFVVRVLDCGYDAASGGPFVSAYLRPSDRDGETADFRITLQGTVRT